MRRLEAEGRCWSCCFGSKAQVWAEEGAAGVILEAVGRQEPHRDSLPPVKRKLVAYWMVELC